MEEEIKARYEASTKAQFEALGRFVQAFEHMVSAMRSSMEGRLQQESRSMVFFTRLIFHHNALTAQPLWDLYRAVVYTDVSELRPNIPPDQEEFHRILATMAKEVGELIKARNIIIHGTPMIGWISSEQEDFTELAINKFRVSATGFGHFDAPKSEADVLSLVDRCQRAERAIRDIHLATMHTDPLRQNMKQRALDELAGRETPDSRPL